MNSTACATAILLASVPLLAQDGQWPMYSGSYSSHRFSPLTQITTENVATLRPAWVNMLGLMAATACVRAAHCFAVRGAWPGVVPFCN